MPPLPASKPISQPPSIDATSADRQVVVPPQAGLVIGLVRAYKVLLSPLFTGCCRYEPSCSTYMADAVRTHGAARGLWLGLKRLARCHPLGSHGFDPVPPRHT